MNIAVDIKTHVIVFIDRSHKYITKEKADKLMLLSTTNLEKFELNGNIYDFRSVTKLLTREEFENEYPEKVKKMNENLPPVYDYSSEVETVHSYLKCKNHRAIIISSVKKYISENKTTGHAEFLLETLQKYDKMQKVPIG